MAYADITVRDPNPIKRWLQRRRFRDALAILYDADSAKSLKILDFGGGDGELFFQLLQRHPNVCVCLYEPNLSLLNEAKGKLSAWEDVYFTSDIGSVDKESFDYVYCLEVFEHLPLEPTRQAISLIYESLKPGGFAIVGVPHELFAPALLKGLFRMFRRYGEFDARFSTIARAAIGWPPQDRPVAEIFQGFSYYFHHLGFDYRQLERCLIERFELVSKWFSPARILGPLLNSEVYFLLRKT